MSSNPSTGQKWKGERLMKSKFYEFLNICKSDDIEKAIEAIEANPSLINMKTEKGETALLFAARYGREKLCKELLKQKATFQEDKYGRTPLSIAAGFGHKQVCRLLLNHKAELKPTKLEGKTPLMAAARSGHLDICKLFVGNGASLHDVSNEGSALHMSTQWGYYDISRFLLDMKGNLDEKTPLYSASLLHLAAFRCDKGQIEFCKFLLESNAHIEARNENGGTPLYRAARNNSYEACKFLLDAKANPNATTMALLKIQEGVSSLHRAAKEGHFKVVELLLDYSAGIDAQDNVGNTPLHYSAGNTHADICKLLVDRGADVTILNKENKKACELATNKRLINMLKETKASKTDISKHGDAPEDIQAISQDTDPMICITVARHQRNKQFIETVSLWGKLKEIEQFDFSPAMRAAEYVETQELGLQFAQEEIRHCDLESPHLHKLIADRNQNRVAYAEAVAEFLNIVDKHPVSVKLDLLKKYCGNFAKEFGLREDSEKPVTVDNVTFNDIKREIEKKLQELECWYDHRREETEMLQSKTEQAVTVAAEFISSTIIGFMKNTAFSNLIDVQVGLEKRDELQNVARNHALNEIQHYAQYRNDDFPVQATKYVYRVLRKYASSSARDLLKIQELALRVRPFILDWNAWLYKEAPTNDCHRKLVHDEKLAARKSRRLQEELDYSVEDQEPEIAIADAREKLKSSIREWKKIASRLDSHLVSMAALSFEHFPELPLLYPDMQLQQFLGMNLGLRQFRRLDHFEDVEEIGSNSRHKIFKGKMDGKWWVMKQFDLKNEKDQQCFMNEAKKLKLLCHPYIVPVESVFITQKVTGGLRKVYGYIQMPFFGKGDLEQMLQDRISDAEKQRICRTLLQGLDHVHRNGIVHCDIAPKNCLIADDYSARLGDFDVSRDDNMRTTTISSDVNATSAGNVIGFTMAYCAPEVLTEKATTKSDIFSMGLVMFDLHFPPQKNREDGTWKFQRPYLFDMRASSASKFTFPIPQYGNPEVDESLRDVLSKMLQCDSQERPSASEILAFSYFQLNLTEGRDANADREECMICFGIYWKSDGIICEENHFLCSECLTNHISSTAEKSTAELERLNGNLHCPETGCKSEPYNIFTISNLCKNPGALSAFFEAQKRIVANITAQSLRDQHKKEIEAIEKASTIQLYRTKIIEDMLVLKCPKCRLAFHDWEGCMAVSCTKILDGATILRNGCGTWFCGWCLKFWGDSKATHGHILECKQRLSSTGYFAELEHIAEIQRKRRERAIKKFLTKIESHTRRLVFDACQSEFIGLGLHVDWNDLTEMS